MAEIKLWIRGVHFHVHPEFDFKKGESTPEMELQTVQKLKELDEQRPEVILVPEPTNPYDPKAIRAWCEGHPIGYVAHEQLDEAHRLFNNPSIPMVVVCIEKVEVRERGNFYVKAELPEEILLKTCVNSDAKSVWKEWTFDIPSLPPQESWTACRVTEFMMERMFPCPEEKDMPKLMEYMKVWKDESLHDFSMEAMRARKHYIDLLRATGDERLMVMAQKLEKQGTAICSDRRMASRLKWWKKLQQSAQMEQYWDKWRSHRKENHLWKDLQNVDAHLRMMPDDLYSSIGDLTLLFSALHYRDDVPRDILWNIYTLLLLRERICRELDIPMKPLPEDTYGVEVDEPMLPELTDRRLAKAIEEHQSFFWGKSAYGVVFCVCRDYFGVPDNMSAFEKRIHTLSFTRKVEDCPSGTIQKSLSNNEYMKKPIAKWEEGRARKLAMELKSYLEKSF